MHRWKRILIFAVFGSLLLSCSSSNEGKLNANNRSTRLAVDYVIVEAELLVNNIEVTGSLMAEESAELTVQTAGKVEEILFKEGQEIKKGQTLLTLDGREWRAQLKRLEAELKMAKKDRVRKAALAEVQGIAEADLEAAQLRVQILEANMEETMVRLSYTTIDAPFSGRIGLRSVSPGSYITAGTTVATIVQENPIKIQFDVPERYASLVRPGQGLKFYANDRPRAYEASVYAYEPMINTSSRAMRVRARANNAEGDLIPGSYINITFTLDSMPHALLVPTEAIIPKLDNQFIYCIENGKAKQVKVRTGIRQPRRIEVIEGLKVGDSVIVTGLLQLKPDMPVVGNKQVEVESFLKGE